MKSNFRFLPSCLKYRQVLYTSQMTARKTFARLRGLTAVLAKDVYILHTIAATENVWVIMIVQILISHAVHHMAIVIKNLNIAVELRHQKQRFIQQQQQQQQQQRLKQALQRVQY